MIIFLDTSSLFKLYHKETGTKELEVIFDTNTINEIILSELTKIEFASTIWKKVRTKELTSEAGVKTIQLFESDYSKFTFIALNSLVIEYARNLISTYGALGLRTLDSIQLASSISTREKVDLFITADLLLQELMNKEGLNVLRSTTI